ncbi:MAG: UvrD-helicase domain-containing protein [Planctomycetota bacterium]
MDPILDDLNSAQRAAVEHGEGPLMVVAGAGSGKTRVITRRVARLLRDGAPSESILALTFTNKAAGEMARRVLDLDGRHVHVATFHSACARYLRRDAERLGYPRNYSIYDTYDRDSCIKVLMQERGLSLTPVRPAHVGSEISRLKNLQVDLAEYRDAASLGPSDALPAIAAELYEPYCERMLRLGAMDFDDLLVLFHRLLVQHPDVAERYGERFRWILVDEFQDTNRIQYELVKAIALRHRNICVVGDPDQSIYRFRGAEIRNILDFQRDFPDVRTVRLEVNYRSTRNILQAAQGVIVHNTERLDRDLDTENPAGEPVQYRRFSTPFEENDAVARGILDLIQDRVPVDEIAVFYRSHFLSRGVEEVLRRQGVPYQVVGGLSFYERREIKDLLAYLRVVINPLDDVSTERIINVPARRIGEASIKKLRAVSSREEMSLYELVMDPEFHDAVPKGARKGLAELREVFVAAADAGERGACEALRAVLETTRYVEHAAKLGDPQEATREENIGELVADAIDFDHRFGGGLEGYLAHVSLLTSQDRQAQTGPTVSLMTVHAAKGLEFDHVFVLGLEDGLFPSSRSLEDGDLEEERRLAYVALTRGRKSVSLSGCRRRMVQGQERDQMSSRFVDEIPAGCLQRVGKGSAVEHHWHSWDADGDEDDLGDFGEVEPIEVQIGARVSHREYGEGVVVRASGRGRSARVVVRFAEGNERTLLLEHANLEIVPGEEEW